MRVPIILIYPILIDKHRQKDIDRCPYLGKILAKLPRLPRTQKVARVPMTERQLLSQRQEDWQTYITKFDTDDPEGRKNREAINK